MSLAIRYKTLGRIKLGFVVALSACAAPVENDEEPAVASLEESIIGGPADPGNGKSIGRLVTPSGGSCTATLISKRVILTAAHCFNFDTNKVGLLPNADQDTGGSQFILDGGETANVVKFAVLSKTLGSDDIAVARLSQDMFTGKPIAVSTVEPAAGAQVFAWGYGCNEGHTMKAGVCTLPPTPAGGSEPFFCGGGAFGTCKPNADQANAPGGVCMAWVTDQLRDLGGCRLDTSGHATVCDPNQICVQGPTANNCFALATPLTPGKKSRATTWNLANHRPHDNVTCAGDSGGPILNAIGAIVAINSAGSGDRVVLSDGSVAFNPDGSPVIPTDGDTPANAVAHRGFITRMNAAYGNGVVCNTCAKVTLRTTKPSPNTNYFLTAVGAGGGSFYANSPVAGTSETFQVVPLVGALVPIIALQTANGYWITAKDGGGMDGAGGAVVADRTLLGSWEEFAWWSHSDGTVNLSTVNKGVFMVADEGGGGTVHANRASAGPWETFLANFTSATLPD